jgi:uncharacterized protein YndB with AHSA1/START domain
MGAHGVRDLSIVNLAGAVLFKVRASTALAGSASAYNKRMDEKVRGYAHRIDIHGDVNEVWHAITDPRSLERWCSPRAEIRPRTGGLFRACVDRVTELEAHIDVFETARRLRLIYLPSPALPPAESALTDDLLLEPMSGGTILRLLGAGVPSDPEWDVQYARLRTGWLHALTRLKVFVEKRSARAWERTH